MLELAGKQIETDAQGYLLHLEDWSEALAEQIAAAEGIALSEAHWEVVLFVRAFYQEYKTSPAIRALVKAIEKAPAEACVPAWPWTVVGFFMRVLPLRWVIKMS